jgi:uncharacterized protein YdeI (YjbR/CyaY-like superfamily)
MVTYERFMAETRADWRTWLKEHHAAAPGVWLVTYKKDSGKPYLAYDATVEEALCYGWIDSRPNKLDDERTMRLFTPRKAGSPWSRLNKERVERLEREGRMTEAGRRKIIEAKENGSWTIYDSVERLEEPADLTAALDAHEAARTHYDAFPDSSKKVILWWIKSAKRPATRAKRLRETVRLAADNVRANHYRQ